MITGARLPCKQTVGVRFPAPPPNSREKNVSAEEIRRIEYVCTKCDEEDVVKLWPNEPVPHVINCWNCHAGFKMAIQDMMVKGVGMFPKQPAVDVLTPN